MKKLLILAIAMMATVNINAQIEEGEWTIMPKVGLGIADLTGKLMDSEQVDGTYDATLHPITSLAAGLEVEYAMTDQLSLALGFVYSTQGAKTNDNLFKVKMDYANIPLTLQYYPIPDCGLAIKAGVQLGIVTRKRLTIDGITYNADYDVVRFKDRFGNTAYRYVESEVSKSFHKVDFSIPLGISYELYNVVLDVRYNWGLTNVMKDDPENSKNSVWQFTLGYKLHLGD